MAAASKSSLHNGLPDWVPAGARHYLVHTEAGFSIRAVARAADCHASTVLRQVRRFENRRDDPLVDDALRQLAVHVARLHKERNKERAIMTMVRQDNASGEGDSNDPALEKEALRALRRLVEPGAVLAVARDMEVAVVVRDGTGSGETTRTATIDRNVAQAMALRDWISCPDPTARIARYHVTGAGRSALKHLMANAENRAGGFAEAPAGFDGAKPVGKRRVMDEEEAPRDFRSALSESPLAGLARRRDKDGELFLSRDLVAVGERLREDFELAQMGPKTTQNWESFLTAGVTSDARPSLGGGSEAARQRLNAALAELGPGLGDVALRCCCFLEGLETTEQKMGWAARSGKIVLRIALQRLKRHYDETLGKFGPMIG